jgi:two-component system cell cycle sensor histidine kinase/response regulator CckA
MTKPLRVLIVEDSPDDADLLARELRRGGFDPICKRVETAAEVSAALDEGQWDIVISDYSMPRFSGPAALRLVRERNATLPFIIVSGTIGEELAVETLKAGANDYLMKDKLARLCPAVKRALLQMQERTSLQHVEVTLRESEERFRSLSASSPVGIFLSDTQGQVIYVNPRARTILGRTLMETLGEGWTQSIHPDDRAAALVEWRARAQSELDHEQEFRVRSPRGVERRVHLRASPMKSEDGRMTGWVGTLEDVTERYAAEQALRASEERYRSLVESARDAIFTMSAEGAITSLNPAFETITGWRREQWLGKEFGPIVHPEDMPLAMEMFLRVIAGETPPPFEVRITTKSGGYVVGEFTVTRQVRDGEFAGILGIARDITERKRLEDQLNQAQKMEAIGQLAGGVAHDFNNILTAITGYSDLALRHLPAEDPMKTNLEEIKAAALRAAGLTRQLLAFSRKQVLQPRVIDLNAVVTDISKMLRRLIGEHIELSTHARRHPALVKADRGQVEQVIMNLAVNARDAMPSGGRLRIETDIVAGAADNPADLPPGEHVVLRISDTGTGMSAETRSRLFEPFFTTKEPGKGTGLGLATCYGIVKQSGGHITVDSEPGKGTTFRIYLPLATEPVAEPAAAPQSAEMPRGRETILLVEDEMVVRELAGMILEDLGYRVLSADHGEEALRLADQHGNEPLPLLLTDVVMPIMGGREVAERLRAKHPGLKVIFSSGYTDDAIAEPGLPDSATWFLEKPYTPDALARKVREALDASPPPA